MATGHAHGLLQVADLGEGVVAGSVAVGGAIARCRWLPDGSGILVAGPSGLNLVTVG